MLKTAKDLVDNAKALVSGAASNQEHLMSAANTVTETIARMANCVKLGAASLGSHQPDAQVMLSVKGRSHWMCCCAVPYGTVTQCCAVLCKQSLIKLSFIYLISSIVDILLGLLLRVEMDLLNV